MTLKGKNKTGMGKSLLCRASLGAIKGRSHFIHLLAFIAVGFFFVTILYGYICEGEIRWKDMSDEEEERFVVKDELFPAPEMPECKFKSWKPTTAS